MTDPVLAHRVPKRKAHELLAQNLREPLRPEPPVERLIRDPRGF